MSEGPFRPMTGNALRERRAARQRARRRWRAGAAAVLAIAIAAVVILTAGGGSHHQRRFEVALKPAPLAAAARAKASASRLVAQENLAIDRLLRRQSFIRWGGSERREIALTFDDGPGPYTPQVLNVLARFHAPATFFEIGFMLRWFHASTVRAVHIGDVIGDHTETHPMMALLSSGAQRSQILDQTEWLRRYRAPFPRLWRPPYGSYNRTTLQILHQLRMLMVLWTVDTNDYLRPGVGTIVHRAVAGARPGAIILMHDAGGDRTQTIAALPLIIRALRKRGYQLVTVPQLILNDPPRTRQQLPSQLAGD